MAENISAAIAWQLADAVRSMTKGKTGPSTGTATFVGTDSTGRALVLLPGADQPTPVHGAISANAEVGSTVTYSLANGQLSITGNASDPAVGESKVTEITTGAIKPLETAQRAIGATADTAQAIASAAQRVANAINQHFFADDNGIHVTQVTQEDWADSQTGPNVLINSFGQLFRDGLTNLLTMTTENGARALTIWDGAGNAAANVLATFGSVVQIGRTNAARVLVDSDSVDMKDGDQLLTSIVGVNADDGRVGGVVSFNGGSKVEGIYASEGESYAERTLHLDAGDGYSSVDSSVAMRALKADLYSDIPYASVDSDGTVTLQSSSARWFALSKSGVVARLHGASADMWYTDYDSKIQLRLPTSGSARIRAYAPNSEVNVYDDRITVTGSVGTGYVYPDRTIMEGDGCKVSLRIGTAYEGVYDDTNSAWIVGKHKTTGVVQIGGMVFRHGVVGQDNDVPASGYKNVSVSFDHTYSAAPHVVVGLYSSSTSKDIGQCSVAVASVTTTGFTARLFNASSNTRAPGFYWIAVG